jgi:hypothetical protein
VAGGKIVAVSLALFVEAFDFGQGPVFRANCSAVPQAKSSGSRRKASSEVGYPAPLVREIRLDGNVAGRLAAVRS